MRKLLTKAFMAAATLGVATLAAAPAANAGLVSTSNQNIVFTITSPEGVSGMDAGTLTATDFGFSGAFPLFDAATMEDPSCAVAGTTCVLQKAVITITGTAGGTVDLYNTTGSSGTVYADGQIGAKLIVNTPFSTTIVSTPLYTVGTDHNCTGGTSQLSPCLTLTVSGTQTVGSGDIAGTNLATLVGTGSTTITGDTGNSKSLLDLSGNVGSSPNITANVSGYIVYTYLETTTEVPAPEPASLALVGVGIAGLAFIRRRRAG